MKSVLLSTRPKWCEKICHEIGTDKNGKQIYEKSIEVRKTKPSIPTPFKVYIYCTQQRVLGEILLTYDKKVEGRNRGFRDVGDVPLAGKIIGEFICDKIDEYKFYNGLTKFNSMGLPSGVYGSYLIFADDYKSMCLSYDEVKNFGKGKTLYGWHISQLKIYDKPKELREFYTIDESGNDCCIACVYHETPIKEMPCRTCTGERRYLYRPPQSWCYVQEEDA
nr:MAG TPA: hypothetical protein [Caudoviricetes sp.]